MGSTTYTNDIVQSEVDKVESFDLKILNTQISKLGDIINKISNDKDEKVNAVILKGLERINTKIDTAVAIVINNDDRLAIDKSKSVV